MIKHIVLFKLKEEHKALIPELISSLYTLKGNIDGLLDLEAGADIVGSSRSFDFGLIATFADRAALDAYQVHPLHVPISQRIGEVREMVAACDYITQE